MKTVIRKTVRSTIIVATLTTTAIGCAWMGTSHSVRFNYFQSEHEMGRLPPLPTLSNGMNELRLQWEGADAEYSDYDTSYESREKRTKEIDGLWERAEHAEDNLNFRLERSLLKEYLRLTEIEQDYRHTPSARQSRRNSAIDRLDALTALDHGSKAVTVKRYLNARSAFDSENFDLNEIDKAVAEIDPDANLKDNEEYLRAALLYRQELFSDAAKAFGALVQQQPRSEKREAALFMSAVSTMKTSESYIPESGNSDYLDKQGTERSIDQAWHQALATFQKCIKEFPRGQYSNDARGWIAYLMLRNHDRAEALCEYYRLLTDQDDENARIQAALSLTIIRSSATEDEIQRVEDELVDEPAAALAYAYHNIYNYSIGPGPGYPPYNEEHIYDSKGEIDDKAEQSRAEAAEIAWFKSREETGRRELVRTLNFSKRLIKAYPNLGVGGAFALRAAQASEELEDNHTAVDFAERALRTPLKRAEREQALWTLGVAQHRLRHFKAARKQLTLLLRDYPDTSMKEATRRILAMIAEDEGDMDGALEQYIELQYDLDVGYFIDRLMTPEQLSGFIDRHPRLPQRNEFTYALGLRYLRLNRWNDARRTFRKVKATGANYPSGSSNCFDNFSSGCVDPKIDVVDSTGKLIITPELLMQEMQTANDLEALYRAAENASGDEAKAEVLYQLASYQYEARELIFYNPLASTGYWNLSMLASENKFRRPNEAQLLFDSTQEHERLARALEIYLQVVQRFPNTRAARDSMYTAAVCHERLSNYNSYWREIYENGLHAGQRMVTYEDVKATYPGYQLPRGTFGWQPSTRTVNGGPGWAPPPKPPLRLSRKQRLLLMAYQLEDQLKRFFAKHARHWLAEALLLAGVLLTWPVAKRDRKTLLTRFYRLRRRRTATKVTYPWFALFWIDPQEQSCRETFKQTFRKNYGLLRDMSQDYRNSHLLIRSFVLHVLLFGSMIALVWMAFFKQY